jgi:hypothetical protein
MLLNSGEYDGVRLLAPHTVALMTSEALPPGVGYSERARTVTGDIAPTPEMGQGFGLGFAVRTAPGRNPLPGGGEDGPLPAEGRFRRQMAVRFPSLTAPPE